MGYKQYCKEPEKIENYQNALADNFKNWVCHHRLETHTSDGKRREAEFSRKELIALGMYYNRPAYELIFLPSSEHLSLHHKGKHISEESRRKLSEALKGEKNPMYGKHHSEEARNKMSEAKKGKPSNMKGKHLSEESKNKMSEAKKGKHLSEETKRKLSAARKDRHWYNNGKISKRDYECPDGFIPGRLKRK